MDYLQTIDHVLDELDQIIAESVQKNDFVGIFAYVYRRTTARVKEGILNNEFEDGHRMEQFDVVFAKLYLKAYHEYRNGGNPNMSWMACFEARKHNITIMQHILMGMSAHINLDLGIAAAQITNRKSLPQLKNDFMKVNNLLFDLIDEMQDRVSNVSRFMSFLDWLGGRKDEKLIGSGIKKFRQKAWNIACELVDVEEPKQKQIIHQLDVQTAILCKAIQYPPNTLLKFTLRVTSWFEEKDIQTIIEKLQSIEEQSFAPAE